MKTMKITREVEIILSLFEEKGYEGYLVGGCVRDNLLGLPIHDYDITTNATPEEMKEIFQGFPVIPTGEKHGTMTVVLNHVPFEITTYRKEADYKDHRHPSTLVFSKTLEDDLKRRDFTMNAMAYSPKEGVKDPFGGVNDIEKHLIRCVGNPRERFNEDALRIMRAIRFASKLGFQIEEDTAKAIHEEKELLHSLSIERIQSEWFGILEGKHVKEALNPYLDVVNTLFPELKMKSEYLEDIEKLPNDPVLRFGYLFSKEEGAVSLLQRLRLSNQQNHDLKGIAKYVGNKLPENKIAWKYWLKENGEDLGRQIISIKEGLEDIEAEKKNFEEILLRNEPYRIDGLAINGNTCLEVGIPQESIGKCLDEVLNQVIEGKLENTTESLTQYLLEKLKS